MSKPIRVWISGSSGRMGLIVQELVVEDDSGFVLIGGNNRKLQGSMLHKGEIASPDHLFKAWKDVDVVIDFSLPEGVDLLCQALAKFKDHTQSPALLVCTTGLESKQISVLKSLGAAGHRILRAPNTSIGILVLRQLAQIATKKLAHLGFDLAILDVHHKNKKDSPSGTALLLKEAMLDSLTPSDPTLDIAVQSIRGGQVFGEHQIKFLGEYEELTLTHQACDRRIFGRGALKMAKWLVKNKPGYYEVDDVEL